VATLDSILTGEYIRPAPPSFPIRMLRGTLQFIRHKPLGAFGALVLIVIIVLVETALITPPVGLNLFVVQSLRKAGSMQAIIVGSFPFVLALFAVIALLAAFPALALWLPQLFG